jgi:hypothetical protein
MLFSKVRITVFLLIARMHAVSQIPLPLIAISTICSLIHLFIRIIAIILYEGLNRTILVLATIVLDTSCTSSRFQNVVATTSWTGDFLVTYHVIDYVEIAILTQYQD